MKIKPSVSAKGILGIFGHAGVGHVHSHLGFVQDDSAGLAVVTALLKQAYPVDTAIQSASVDRQNGAITVVTAGGGTGTATARRGITPFEADILQRAVGQDAQYSQAVAFRTFGRIYGQGVMEPAVALQGAAALAVIDTFERNAPGHVVAAPEDIPGNTGRVLGTVLDFDETPVAVLATVNATAGGLGPNEDLEGNVRLGEKGRLIRQLGLEAAPGIVVESKTFVPAVCKDITENTFLFRANAAADNVTVAACLAEAAAELNQPHMVSDTAFPRGKHDLAAATEKLGKEIADLGMQLASATTAGQKVMLVGRLAEMVSQDAGGVTFMSNFLHNVVSGAGTVPGTAAVMSLLVTPAYIAEWKIPFLTPEDVERYAAIVSGAIRNMAARRQEAEREILAKRDFNDTTFSFLFHPNNGG